MKERTVMTPDDRRDEQALSAFLDRIGEVAVVELEEKGVTLEVEVALRGERAYALRLQRGELSCRVMAKVLWSRLDRTRRKESGEVAAVYRVRLDVEEPESLSRVLGLGGER